MPDFSTPEVTAFDYMLNKCWKDSPNFGRCHKDVKRDDPLGLCPDHVEEMRESQ